VCSTSVQELMDYALKELGARAKPCQDCQPEEGGANGAGTGGDRGYISFSEQADLKLSRGLNPAVLEKWGIALPRNVGAFRPEQCRYLDYHRTEVFEKTNSKTDRLRAFRTSIIGPETRFYSATWQCPCPILPRSGSRVRVSFPAPIFPFDLNSLRDVLRVSNRCRDATRIRHRVGLGVVTWSRILTRSPFRLSPLAACRCGHGRGDESADIFRHKLPRADA
jgi:hypothetical protein